MTESQPPSPNTSSKRDETATETNGESTIDNTTVDGPTVRVIGPSLPYADEAEARIRAVIEAADDVSSGSDELQRAIDDWPSRYHLSAARGGLLAPFQLGPGQRILEVGAGCGAITRYLAETGADVVALEGNQARAETAAVRCRGLTNVEVLSGPLAALDDDHGFDVVVVIGVLEYAGDRAGGGGGATAFLADLKRLLRDDGCLILAIENQLGLRYLLGYPEDHVGEPWVGVAGYPGDVDVRTYARRGLNERLMTSGFVRQRWFFPFPDYKLPRLMLADGIYDQSDAVDFVDQLVRSPAPRDERDTAPLTEERAVHRTFLAAGLGRDVANAFVICASAHGGDPSQLAPPNTLAWILSQSRRRPWRRLKTVKQGPTGRTVEARPLAATGDDEAPGPALPPWLQHHARDEQSYTMGTTVEQQVLAACRAGDEAAVATVLASWDTFLDRHEAAGSDTAPTHPLAADATAARLPASMVDVDLANFVVDINGALHYVDDEWQAAGGVDGRLARLRALWHLSVDLVGGRVPHPWPRRETPMALLEALAAACGMTVTDDDRARLGRAEAALVAAVTGTEAASFARQWTTVASWTGPQSPLEAQLAGVIDGQAQATRAYEAEIAQRGDALAALHERVANLDAALHAAQQERDTQRRRADQAGEQLRMLQHSRFWRVWQRLGALRRTFKLGS